MKWIIRRVPFLPGARKRLRKILQTSNVQLIASGHLHVYRTIHTSGMTVVSAPTLMRGDNDYLSNNGYAVNGILEYSFEGDGVEFRLVEPPGVHRPQLRTDHVKIGENSR